MMNIMNPPADWSTMKKLIWLRGTPINGGEDLTVTGTPPLTLPNSLGKPLKAWSVDLLPYQEGTGDPSPSNVRPIHGTDKVTVWTGVDNTIDPANIIPRPDPTYGLSATVDGSWIVISGTYIGPIASPQFRIASFYDNTEFPSNMACYPDSNSANNIVPTSAGRADSNKTLTIYLRNMVQNEAYNLRFQLDGYMGSSAPAEYVPYISPSQTVITLPQTVYTATISEQGGEGESGELIVDGVNNYIETSGNYCNIKPYGVEASPIFQGGWRCSTFPTNTTYMGYNSTYKFIFFNKNAFSAIGETDEELNAYCQAHPIQIIYRKATPESIALSAPSIPTPTGTATTWATAEDGTVESMEVTYVGKA